MAEWLRRGLQILAPRFDSGRGLHFHHSSVIPYCRYVRLRRTTGFAWAFFRYVALSAQPVTGASGAPPENPATAQATPAATSKTPVQEEIPAFRLSNKTCSERDSHRCALRKAKKLRTDTDFAPACMEIEKTISGHRAGLPLAVMRAFRAACDRSHRWALRTFLARSTHFLQKPLGKSERHLL